MSRHEYQGEKLTIHYDTRTCIHAGECVKGLPEVFNPKNKPWVSADATEADRVAATIACCPTGALTYTRTDGGEAEQPAAENTVRIDSDGPVFLQGDLEISGADGQTLSMTRAAICRCGASHHKPFCDGSHGDAGFADPGVIGEAKTKDAAAGQTNLKVRVLPDGPVLLDGPYRLLDTNGETHCTTGSGYLCRCGASNNKPYCDGQHKPAGFQDPAAIPGA